MNVDLPERHDAPLDRQVRHHPDRSIGRLDLGRDDRIVGEILVHGDRDVIDGPHGMICASCV